MPSFVFANRVSALITATVSSTDTTVQLEAGAGAILPVLNAGEIIRATLIDPSGVSEIVNGILVVGDVVTLERGQEGTPASTFATGSRFEMRMTAGIADSFLQKSGGVMTGPIDMANNEIKRAKFTSSLVFDTIHVRLLRAATTPVDIPFQGLQENAIVMPDNNNPTNYDLRRPRYFGRAITNAQMFEHFVFDFIGDINNLPSHLKLCNGSQSTPDLRGRFCRGWDATFGVGSYGGVDQQRTTDDGAHAHGTITAQVVLTIDQIPSHSHGYNITAGSGGTEGSGPLGAQSGRTTTLTGGGQGHAHGIPPQAAHSHLVTVLPAFFGVAKAMFKI